MCHDTLILIDTKVFEFTEAFMREEPEAVTSMSETVEGASNDWDSKVDKVRLSPQLLGLNMPTFKIDGIVIVPFVPFVQQGLATRLVCELPHVASLGELIVRAQRS
jgi:hypothetical protein